jgi:hypothetical protein
MMGAQLIDEASRYVDRDIFFLQPSFQPSGAMLARSNNLRRVQPRPRLHLAIVDTMAADIVHNPEPIVPVSLCVHEVVLLFC